MNLNEPLKTVIIFQQDNDMPVEKMVEAAAHALLRVESEWYFLLDMSNQYRKPLKASLPKCSIKTVIDNEDFDQIIEKCKKEGLPYGVERAFKRKSNNPIVCLVVGPDLNSKVNKVTRKLKKLKQ